MGQAAPRAARPKGTLNEKRWAEVVRAAVQVFDERGYQAATLEDIASRVGLLKGSLYYYIDSKEDLLYAALRRAHERGLSFAEEDDATVALPAPARLEAFIRRWMRGLAAGGPELNVSERDLRHLTRARQKTVRAMREQLTQFAAAIVVAGIEEGSFSAGHDPYVVSVTLFRVLSGMPRSLLARDRLDETTEWYVHLFLGALTTD
jgi:AcrR family transcriptional regulator